MTANRPPAFAAKISRRSARLALAAIGAAAAFAGPAAASAPWTGLGAPLAAWKAAHGPYRGSCPIGGCYGRGVKVNGRLVSRFVEVTTAGGAAMRVDGYTQAIGDGTSLGKAKAEVRALLPADARTTSFRIVHSHGDSCALWDLQTQTLGRWLAGTKADDPHGNLGINLNTVTNAGFAYHATDVSEAIVSTTPYQANSSC